LIPLIRFFSQPGLQHVITLGDTFFYVNIFYYLCIFYYLIDFIESECAYTYNPRAYFRDKDMVSKEKMRLDVKWATRQRLQYIEIMAYYTGIITRSEVAKAFGMSDAAATKDLKLYSDLAPDNLIYKHTVFGFVPSEGFREVFADLSPAAVLPMIAANLAATGGPYDDDSIYGVTVETLPTPNRLPDKAVLAQILRAIKAHTKLEAVYYSLSDRDNRDPRILEPHSLVNTGLRWHVRAYSEDTYDFRDFVLSRFVEAKKLEDTAESSAQYDDDWSEVVTLRLTPHPKLDTQKRMSLMIDYRGDNELIELTVRRALIGYVLQRLSVDTTADHSLNPSAYQLILVNRDEIEPFASWAFHD
jgi:predicted DNA-binding transcriptional regulator YafY